MDGKFRGVWETFRTSPYPLHYALRWPFYFQRPSVRNHTGLVSRSASLELHPLPDSAGTDRATLLFAGDIMVLNGDAPPHLCDSLRRLIGRADLFVANLEAPLGAHAQRPDILYSFRFHMPFDFLAGIQRQVALPFRQWALTVANNHSGDAGPDGFSQSIDLLDSLQVNHVGWKPGPLRRTVAVNGLRIGLVNWTHWENLPLQADAAVVPYTTRDLGDRGLPGKDVDFTIGLPHWEYEFQHFPRRETRRLAHRLLQDELDLIVGSHPHVLQPYEMLGDKLCFYSLGNFCGLGIAWPVKIITLLEAVLFRDGLTGKTRLSRFQYHHFYQYHRDDEIFIVAFDDLPQEIRTRADNRIDAVIRTPA